MKSTQNYVVMLVTAPNLRTARTLVKLALASRLVACGNLVPKLESHYWWKDKIERSREVLIIFKTTARRLKALERLVLSNHPYETPEVIAMPISHGTPAYLRWITASVRGNGRN